MNVGLDAGAIEREYRGAKDLGLHHRRTGIFAADIRLEQRRRLRFERAVDAELGGRDLEPRAAVLLPQALDALDLGRNLARRPSSAD